MPLDLASLASFDYLISVVCTCHHAPNYVLGKKSKTLKMSRVYVVAKEAVQEAGISYPHGVMSQRESMYPNLWVLRIWGQTVEEPAPFSIWLATMDQCPVAFSLPCTFLTNKDLLFHDLFSLLQTNYLGFSAVEVTCDKMRLYLLTNCLSMMSNRKCPGYAVGWLFILKS